MRYVERVENFSNTKRQKVAAIFFALSQHDRQGANILKDAKIRFRLRIPKQLWTKSVPASLWPIVTNLKFFKSEFVKRKTIRYAFEFVVRASIQFLRRPNRSRELGRVNGTALLGPKRYFFHTDCAFFDPQNVCVKRFLRFVSALCVSRTKRLATTPQRDVKIKNNQCAIFFFTLLKLF